MFRTGFAIFIFIHALIHLMGFSKAFGFGSSIPLSKFISQPQGMAWLIACVLFIASGILFLMKAESWWVLALLSCLLSQVLLFIVWQDARFGSIANAVILIVVFFGFSAWKFERSYHQDVQNGIIRVNKIKSELIEDGDLEHLPATVQKYLRYTRAVGTEKVSALKISFRGSLRDKGKDWFPFYSEQYNFFDEPTRLFFMKGLVNGFTVPGYHSYMQGNASMQIKLFGLFPVVNASGRELFEAETVTLLNDMCLMAPATLIDPRIRWEVINEDTVKAVFTNQGVTVSAVLHFNKTGQLVNFISDDRYAMADMKKHRFSTPVNGYEKINGHRIPTYAETIWHYPEGDFVYGKFNLVNVEYNPR